MNALRKFRLGEVIAERTMQFVATAGWSRDGTIRVGRPVRDTQSNRAWVCPFQIEGLGSAQVVGIFGADAMQALLLDLHTIPGQLAPYLHDPGGTFMYLGHPDSSFVDSCRTVLEYAGAAFPPEQG